MTGKNFYNGGVRLFIREGRLFAVASSCRERHGKEVFARRFCGKTVRYLKFFDSQKRNFFRRGEQRSPEVWGFRTLRAIDDRPYRLSVRKSDLRRGRAKKFFFARPRLLYCARAFYIAPEPFCGSAFLSHPPFLLLRFLFYCGREVCGGANG